MRLIAQIDKDINAVHRQLRRLEKIDTLSAASWQNAWDKHPDLHEKAAALYRERDKAQCIEDDGTSGQDRDTYSDDQDRDCYTANN